MEPTYITTIDFFKKYPKYECVRAYVTTDASHHIADRKLVAGFKRKYLYNEAALIEVGNQQLEKLNARQQSADELPLNTPVNQPRYVTKHAQFTAGELLLISIAIRDALRTKWHAGDENLFDLYDRMKLLHFYATRDDLNTVILNIEK